MSNSIDDLLKLQSLLADISKDGLTSGATYTSTQEALTLVERLLFSYPAESPTTEHTPESSIVDQLGRVAHAVLTACATEATSAVRLMALTGFSQSSVRIAIASLKDKGLLHLDAMRCERDRGAPIHFYKASENGRRAVGL